MNRNMAILRPDAMARGYVLPNGRLIPWARMRWCKNADVYLRRVRRAYLRSVRNRTPEQHPEWDMK